MQNKNNLYLFLAILSICIPIYSESKVSSSQLFDILENNSKKIKSLQATLETQTEMMGKKHIVAGSFKFSAPNNIYSIQNSANRKLVIISNGDRSYIKVLQGPKLSPQQEASYKKNFLNTSPNSIMRFKNYLLNPKVIKVNDSIFQIKSGINEFGKNEFGLADFRYIIIRMNTNQASINSIMVKGTSGNYLKLQFKIECINNIFVPSSILTETSVQGIVIHTTTDFKELIINQKIQQNLFTIPSKG